MSGLTVLQLVPSLGAGGAERSTLEIAGALVRDGHRALVASRGGAWVERLERLGARHITLDLASKNPRVVANVPALTRLLRTEAVTLLHARSRLPAWLARLALATLPRASRPRFVTTVHGLNSPGRYSRVMIESERAIVVSQSVHDFLCRNYPTVERARLVVIPRGIDPLAWPRTVAPDPAWRARFDREWPPLAGRAFVTLAARGTRLKNHRAAITLIARLARDHGLDMGLLLAGVVEPGRESYLDELAQHARALGVVERVAFAPARADLAAVYAASAAVLQLSQKPESFGRTVLEALSVGTPVIGYAHGGVGELLDELYPDGRIAPFDDAALAASVARLGGARVTVAMPARYTVAAMQASTLALYRALIDAPR